MSLLVASAVLASALLHAAWNAALKGRAGSSSQLAKAVGLSATWTVLGLPLAVLVGPPPRDAWPYLAATVPTHVVYFALLVAAYRRGDLSLVYPLIRGLPPLLVLGLAAAFVGEQLPRHAVAGIALVTVGILVIGGPAIRRKGSRSAIGLALMTVVLIAAYTTIDGVGARRAGAVTYIVWMTTIQGAVFALGGLALGGRPVAREVWATRDTGFLTGIMSAGGYGVALWAMTQAPLAPVAALRETSVVFGAVFGTALLGEPFGRRRVLGACLVASGVGLVQWAG